VRPTTCEGVDWVQLAQDTAPLTLCCRGFSWRGEVSHSVRWSVGYTLFLTTFQ
jgi:hypothetical protein